MIVQKKYLGFRFLLKYFIFFVSLFWVIGIISPCTQISFLQSNYPVLKLCYSIVCHQTASKSIICGDTTFLVCARCTGIYFAVLITSFIVLFVRTNINVKTIYLVIFSIPMLADVIFYSLGLYHYNKIVAVLTGFLFGSAVFLYILSAIENSFLKINS